MLPLVIICLQELQYLRGSLNSDMADYLDEPRNGGPVEVTTNDKIAVVRVMVREWLMRT